MKRMLANKRGQSVQGNQCCFQALEVLIQLKNSKQKKMKPDICQTDSPGARIAVVSVFQVHWSRSTAQSLCMGGIGLSVFTVDEEGVVNVPFQQHLICPCSWKVQQGWALQFSAHIRISCASTKPAASSGLSAERLHAVVCRLHLVTAPSCQKEPVLGVNIPEIGKTWSSFLNVIARERHGTVVRAAHPWSLFSPGCWVCWAWVSGQQERRRFCSLTGAHT